MADSENVNDTLNSLSFSSIMKVLVITTFLGGGYISSGFINKDRSLSARDSANLARDHVEFKVEKLKNIEFRDQTKSTIDSIKYDVREILSLLKANEYRKPNR